MDNTTFDDYWYLYSGTTGAGGRVAKSDGNINHTLQPGVYLIAATSYSSEETGRFTLTVNGLPATATPPGAATISSVTPGPGSLTVSWSAPPGGASGITAYDLRFILTSADETVDANWTLVPGVWTAGIPLRVYIEDLTDGVQYDVQVRAVNSVGDGPWSATVTGTPATPAGPGATQLLLPGARWLPEARMVTVTINALGQLRRTRLA